MRALILLTILSVSLLAQSPPGWSIDPGPTLLPPRVQFAMAYDPVRDEQVVFGGRVDAAAGNLDLDETWVRTSSGAWIQRTPAGPVPPARKYGIMAWDSLNERIILFGGITGSSHFGDTWAWNGTLWQDLTGSTGLAPSARTDHAMATDPDRKVIVLYGGGGPFSNDGVWEFDGASWSQVSGSAQPGPRHGHRMAYCGLTGSVIMYGGDHQPQPYFHFIDTWSWDGSTWTLVDDGAGVFPGPRTYSAMSAISVTGEVYVTNGYDWVNPTNPQPDDSIWAYRGFGEGWTKMLPSGLIGPGSRRVGGMAETGDGRLVLVGGSRITSSAGIPQNDTWIVSGLEGAYPGDHIDLDISSFMGPFTTNPVATRGPGADVKLRNFGDNLLVLKASSPQGSLDGQLLFFVAEIRPTGSPLPTLFPNLYVDPTQSQFFFLKNPSSILGSCILLSGGTTLSYFNPGIAPGNSLFVQAASTMPTPGLLALSDAHEIRF